MRTNTKFRRQATLVAGGFAIHFLVASLFIGVFQVSYGQVEEVKAIIDEFRKVTNDWPRSDSILRSAAIKARELGDQEGELYAKYLSAENQIYQGNFDSSIMLFHGFLTLAKKYKDKRQIIYGYHQLSNLYGYKGNQDTALQFINFAITSAEDIQDSSNIGFGYRMRANIRELQAQHFHALQDLVKALEVFEVTSRAGENRRDTRNLGLTYQDIGQIYMDQNDFAKSQIYCEQALDIFSSIRDTAEIISIYNDFGILYKRTKNYQEAEKFYLKVLELNQARTIRSTNAVAYGNLGSLKYEMGHFAAGETYALQALEWVSDQVPAHLSDIYNTLAKNQLSLKKTDIAQINASKALEAAEKATSLERKADALLTLSMIHEERNLPIRSLYYFKQHKTLHDSLFNEEKTNIIHDIETKYETEKKEAEIVLLEKNAALDSAQKKSLKIGLILISLIGLSVAYTLMLRRKKDQKIYAQEKEIAQEKRRNLEQELVFKKKELIAKVLQLASKNEFLQKLQSEVASLKSSVDHGISKTTKRISRMIRYDQLNEDEWTQFSEEFNAVHSDFIEALHKTYGSFTHSEMRLITLLKMNLSTKEIAQILRISDQSIWKARYRLRKKMELDGEEDLQALLLGM